MNAEPLVINKETIQPGEVAELKIYVGKLPSGARIFIRGQVIHSKIKGPTVLLTGGIHGDEINSVHIVRRFMSSSFEKKLLRGTIISIPVVNVYGFIYFSRDLPDGKDVNRSFPGSSRGSLASRIAATITKKIIPLVDYGLDFHTGGASRFNYPQVRFSRNDKVSEELARAFGAPQALSRGTIPKSLRRVALSRNIPYLVFEGGESLRLNGHAISVATNGIERVLHHLEMLDSAPPKTEKTIHITKTRWIRASQAGLFTWAKSSGDFVNERDTLGVIQDPQGALNVKVTCRRPGYLVGHNNAAVVSMGDALFHLGYEFEEWPI